MKVSREQAAAFLEKVIGSELCTGAGEDESATYLISPVPRAFLQGAIVWENVPNSMWSTRVGWLKPDDVRPLAEFLVACGEALLEEPPA